MLSLALVTLYLLVLGFAVASAKPGTARSRPGTTRFLAEHTNAILRAKCRPTYASLAGPRRLWVRRHLRAHRVKKGVCAPPTPWPSWWYGQAMCIHGHEGSWTADTGNGYGGGFQFLVSTWNRAPRLDGRIPFASSTSAIARLSPYVQTLAAFVIWRQDGGSWREWGTARKCGLA